MVESHKAKETNYLILCKDHIGIQVKFAFARSVSAVTMFLHNFFRNISSFLGIETSGIKP